MSSDFPVPAGPITQRARAGRDAAAQELIELGNAARHDLIGEALAVIGGHQPGKHLHTAHGDHEVMVARAKGLAAALDDAQTAPLAAIDRRQLIEVNDAVGDAVHRPIGGLGGEIVEHDHGRVVLGEVVLERQDLPAIAQRALRQEADFRQAVDHHALGLEPLDGLEDALDGLAELEIGGIEQALVLIRIKHAFGRDQLEYLDGVRRSSSHASGPRRAAPARSPPG